MTYQQNSFSSAPLFDRSYLTRLIMPLIAEQFLAVMIGACDTVMVATSGEAAVSGVSLIDLFSQLMIQLFSAFATGGAVVASQYLGHKDTKSACESAKQLLNLCMIAGLAMVVIFLPFRKPILSLLFGKISADVMANALVYFIFIVISFPFLAVYNSCAALYRSMGNSKLSLKVSLLMNCINIGGNALLIYGCGMGAAGAGIATLASRAVSAVIMVVLLCNPAVEIHFDKIWHFEWNRGMIHRILRIGVPSGIENSVFQIGKLLVQTFMAGFGTAALAANAIANNVASMANIPGNALGLASVTVVGQCIGAGEKKQAVWYAKKLLWWTSCAMAVIAVSIGVFAPHIVRIFHLGIEASDLATGVIRTCMIADIFFWPLSFTLPNSLRAAGDAKFTMIVSNFSMWVFRVLSSYLISSWILHRYPGHPGYALYGVWIGMYIDWVCRAAFYALRFKSGRWLEKKVI
jgi:putative MATE family efflux protein